MDWKDIMGIQEKTELTKEEKKMLERKQQTTKKSKDIKAEKELSGKAAHEKMMQDKEDAERKKAEKG